MRRSLAVERGCGRQASVNPKAETCEDLQSRRKRLHLGMCKLAGEDLERKALEKEAEFHVSLGL